MASPADWVLGYARQADADFKTWQALQTVPEVAECHGLLFLQMACEKVCKAHLIEAGTPPSQVQSSHGYIAKPLPVVIRQQIARMRQNVKGMKGVLILANQLAAEIELLNPSIDRDGRRPDNCEYPWEDGNAVLRSPLDWTFSPSQLLSQRHGSTFLKLLRAAIDDYLD